MGIRLTNCKQLQSIIKGDSKSKINSGGNITKKRRVRAYEATDEIMLDERDTKPLEPMELT